MLSQTGLMRSIQTLSAFAALSLLIAAPALASRAPTLREREEITNSYPAYIRNAPVECVFIEIRVSSRDARYALVGVQALNALKHTHAAFVMRPMGSTS